MPNLTGLELARKLRADGAAIPILLITGSPSPLMTASAAELGIKILDKPPGEEALIGFINSARP
jgi:two-component system, LuxR family, response regulator FixJ